jgi:peptidoglycan/LPS O-acetylase OafA/YrhL
MTRYFTGLNSLRFFAAVMVLFSHIESFKAQAGMPNLTAVPFVAAMGQHGVRFFFVLSGFLIRYLLHTEQQRTGTIKVRDFYMRRVLRIWPLYFLIVIVCLWVLPQIYDETFLRGDLDTNFAEKAMLLVLMLPNLMQYMYGHILGLGVLWSVGIEEQFYLMFPWIVKFVTKHFEVLIVPS